MGEIFDFRKNQEDFEEFKVPATDTKGHSDVVRARCPPHISSEIAEVIASRSFPYKTVSSLIRHAVWRHLKWLRDRDPSMRGDMAWLEFMLTVIQKSEKMLEYSAVLGELDRVTDLLLKAGDKDEAKRTVLHCVKVISEGSGKDSWKRKALMHIKKKHAGLISVGVSIDPSEFEKEE